MIEVYKIVSCNNTNPDYIGYTLGNDLRPQKCRLKYDMRKFYFTNRVVDQWNSLPNWVVTANNTQIF